MKYYILVILCLILTACEQEVSFSDLSEPLELSKDTLTANGSDAFEGFVRFNRNADISKLIAKVKAVNLTLSGSENGELKLTPVRKPNGNIEASFTGTSTTLHTPGKISLNINEFEEDYDIYINSSIVSSINTLVSAPSLLPNFSEELTVTGKLVNENGKKVSNGVSVLFEDLLLNGNSANGNFRAINSNSNSESEVSAIYSAGNIEADQFVLLKITVLDESGTITSIASQQSIYIRTK